VWQTRLGDFRDRALILPGMRRFVRAVLLVAHGFRGEAITLRASALTYLTLLALVPLLAVIYSVVDLISGQAPFHDTVQSYVNSQLGIGAGAAIAGSLTTFTSKATVQTLGAIGFAALLVSVLSLLWNIESAFNHIYGVKRPRGPIDRLLKYWSFLTLGPVMLSASLYVTWQIGQMQEYHHLHNAEGHSEILHALAALSSILITYAGLAFLYKVLPNARVRLRSAAIAAFSAGTAWELAKYVFALASARMVQVHKIYGSLAVLPIVLTWIYISWSIALVGCRLCYAMDASRKPEAHPALLAAAARETFVARVMILLVLLHREATGPLRELRLTRELSCTRRMLREALSALEAAGLAVQARKGGWLPARDASLMTLAQVRGAGRSSLAFPPQDPDLITEAISAAWAQAEGAAEGALGESLHSFLERLQEPEMARTPPPAALSKLGPRA
jgi:membrane protein